MITSTKSVTAERLAKLPPPHPKETGDYWRPLPHSDLLAAVTAEAQKRGWLPFGQTVHLSRNGLDMAASIDMALPAISSEAAPSIGITNSNSRTYKATLWAGVRLGHNCNRGGIPFTKISLGKHTSGLTEHLEEEVAEACHLCEQAFRKILPTIEWLKNKPIMDAQRFLVAAGRAGIMPWSRIGLVDSALRKNDLTNAWDLLKTFASVAIQNKVLSQLDWTYRFVLLVRGKE